MASYEIIIPLNVASDVWSFVRPHDYEVWICFLASVPILILTFLLGDYLVYPAINLDTWASFVFRNALSEVCLTSKQLVEQLPGKKLYLYQQLLMSVWVWSCFLLIMAYAGNLTAMIARPKLDMKFNKPEDLLHQDEIKLLVEDGIGAIEYMSQAPTGSTLRRLIGKTEVIYYDYLDPEEKVENCFTSTDRYTGNKNYAAICDIDSIKSRLSADFSKTGQCNWYTTQKSLFHSSHVMVFQVSNVQTFYVTLLFLYFFLEREPLSG